MTDDEKVQQDILDQIKWSPVLSTSRIGVSVRNGIVTLSGQVDTYQKKLEAAKEVKKVAGVKAIAEDIQVVLSPRHQKPDADLAESILVALQWHTSIPQDKIKVYVADGVVTLEGEVEWDYERTSAANLVSNLVGVRQVINAISLRKNPTIRNLKNKILAAFHRSATIDASKIQVEIIDSKAILKGKVRSYAEKEDAESGARSTPGILEVDNKLQVREKVEGAPVL
jgi:osmotically-inducible protein OsmY